MCGARSWRRGCPDLRGSLAALGLAVAGVGSTSCGGREATPAPAAHCPNGELVIAASTDYRSGAICAVPPLASAFRGTDLADPVLASGGGRTFLIGRGFDVLFELEPSCGTPISRTSVHDFGRDVDGVHIGANPHDVCAAPDGTLFVTLFDVGKLGFVKNGVVDGFLDLSSYDTDGNPDPEAVRVVDVGGAPKVFVTLERLDASLRPKGASQMLRVDATTRTVEAVLPLVGDNPFNTMAEQDGYLYLAEPRDFDVADEDRAGIERFDTRTSTSSMLVREAALGGSVAEIAVTRGCGAAIVAGPVPAKNPTSLVTFDPDTGEVFMSVATSLLTSEGYDLRGLAWRGDVLYVGDRRPGSGGYPIHVFERSPGTCQLTSSARVVTIADPPVALRPATNQP